MFVDTHAHVYNETYDDVEEVIKNAKEAGIFKIINCGESVNSSKEVVSLCKNNDAFLCTVGIHPEYANKTTEKDINKIEKLLQTGIPIAVGEIGLDYHYEDLDKEKQKDLFKKQLDLAAKYKLPIILHNREATNDIITILKEYKLKGIFHCFSGSKETAKEIIEMGYYLGIGGLITFKNCKLIDLLKEIGIDNIVLETDCPFLTPEPFRKYKNEPKYIKNIAEFIEINVKINIENLAYITNRNIDRIFDIKL